MYENIQEINNKIYQRVDEKMIGIRDKLLKEEWEIIKKDFQQVTNALSAIIEELEKK